MSDIAKVTLEKITALCKRRGFVYQSADLYGGLNGVYDFGHLGTLMKDNIRKQWKHAITQVDGDVVFLDGAILGPQAVWQASGHVKNFHDPMVDCTSCQKRFRADDINIKKACPHCGNTAWTQVREFNLMFQTKLGAASNHSAIAYLRPETAQTIFSNFKNIFSTNRVKIPFGIAQIGKAFRNEITPKQFLFRMREFEQMELEWFCKPNQSDNYFDFWKQERFNFYKTIGINPDKIRLRPHEQNELAHYSTQCIDVEYQFPFGWKELEGIADRGNYDLTQHAQESGKDLSQLDEETKERFVPHVIESSVGVDRLFLTLLFDAYSEEQIENDTRTVLKLHKNIAPIKIAILPLSKQLSDPAKQLFSEIKKRGYNCVFDQSGSIGKRYRRNDEIGTPLCITYDFDSQEDNCVTIRDRDTLKQERVAIDKIITYLYNYFNQ